MQDARDNPRASLGASDAGNSVEAWASAVSWPAIIAGAFVIASASLILLALGSGLGLAMVSPWPNRGASVTTFSIVTALGLIVVQWLSSGLGGYLTGRLRTKWARIHTHEVFFRDTAHGFLTWALATVIGAFLLASATSSVVGGGVQAAATVASGAAQGAANSAGSAALDPRAYDIDSLFRSSRPDANTSTADTRLEATRILAKGVTSGEVPAADRTYLAQLAAARTGISEADAQKRVDDVIAQEKVAETKVRQAADAARKAASALSIFTALSMLVGALIASAAAALGGQQRDENA